VAADLTATPGNPASYKGSRAVVRHPALHTYAGRALDRGQVFRMRGLDNDDRLIRLGFAAALPAGEETAECPACGAAFAPSMGSAMTNRDNHANRRHIVRDVLKTREARASDIDAVDEFSLRGAEPESDPGVGGDVPPLYLDQTAAERGVKSETITL
jgi:hypothetical protein